VCERAEACSPPASAVRHHPNQPPAATRQLHSRRRKHAPTDNINRRPTGGAHLGVPSTCTRAVLLNALAAELSSTLRIHTGSATSLYISWPMQSDPARIGRLKRVCGHRLCTGWIGCTKLG
jgi:hypothetical protein